MADDLAEGLQSEFGGLRKLADPESYRTPVGNIGNAMSKFSGGIKSFLEGSKKPGGESTKGYKERERSEGVEIRPDGTFKQVRSK